MRAFVVVLVVLLRAAAASAEPLPSGTIGPVFGITSGTGADAKRLGYGFYPFGLQASWQPMSTEHKRGWSLRWATLFGRLYNGDEAQIGDELRTVQMDVMAGIRVRPWATPRRYLTFRVGGEILRVDQPISRTSGDTERHRNFVGGIASVGLDQYIGGFMLDIDVRYGMIASGPTQIAVLVGIGFTGP
jgi:hypothetical protein